MYVCMYVCMYVYNMYACVDYTFTCICLFSCIVPTGPPNNVSLIILDPWSIALSWTEPDHELQNGVIRNYSVVVLNSDKETIQSITEVTTNLNISALKPYTIYHVQVAANTVGVGPYSKPLMVQMPESSMQLIHTTLCYFHYL